MPEQEVIAAGGSGSGSSWTLNLRGPLAVERHNAQLSLLTGMAAAGLMLAGGAGLLRTLPPPEPQAVGRLRRTAAGLGVSWAPEAQLGDGLALGAVVDARPVEADPAQRRVRFAAEAQDATAR